MTFELKIAKESPEDIENGPQIKPIYIFWSNECLNQANIRSWVYFNPFSANVPLM